MNLKKINPQSEFGRRTLFDKKKNIFLAGGAAKTWCFERNMKKLETLRRVMNVVHREKKVCRFFYLERKQIVATRIKGWKYFNGWKILGLSERIQQL